MHEYNTSQESFYTCAEKRIIIVHCGGKTRPAALGISNLCSALHLCTRRFSRRNVQHCLLNDVKKLNLLAKPSPPWPFIMVSYLDRQSVQQSIQSIMHIWGPSLLWYWQIHQAFVFLPHEHGVDLPAICSSKEPRWNTNITYPVQSSLSKAS